MTCSCRGNVLQPVHRCETKGRVRRPRNEKSVLWEIKKCLQCRDALPALTRGGLERRPQDSRAPCAPLAPRRRTCGPSTTASWKRTARDVDQRRAAEALPQDPNGGPRLGSGASGATCHQIVPPS